MAVIFGMLLPVPLGMMPNGKRWEGGGGPQGHLPGELGRV
jgi:hypothetical protein